MIELLSARGHLVLPTTPGATTDEWALTPSGQRLARLYHEVDLLVIEALEDGLFDGLNPAELAALASALTYEERRSSPGLEVWYPTSELRRRFIDLEGMHMALVIDEQEADLPLTRRPDAGFMAIAHGWAAGGGLADVIGDADITAGDFVRTSKQLIDLLRQLGSLAPSPATASTARAAAEAFHRDLIAASSSVEPPADGGDPELDESPDDG